MTLPDNSLRSRSLLSPRIGRLIVEPIRKPADESRRIGSSPNLFRECYPCGSVNAISTARPTSYRRSRPGLLRTKSLFRPLNRTNRRNMKTVSPWISDETARRQGRSRRDFLRSGSGMAAALMALPKSRSSATAIRSLPTRSLTLRLSRKSGPKIQFVFDVQTHHVDVNNKWYDETPTGRGIRSFFLMLRSGCQGHGPAAVELPQPGPLRQGSLRQTATPSCRSISGVPSRDWDKNRALPPDQMVETRRFVNELARFAGECSPTGSLRPNLGKPELEEMERPGQGLEDRRLEDVHRCGRSARRAWRMDGRESRLSLLGENQAPWSIKKPLCPQRASAGSVQRGRPAGRWTSKRCRPRLASISISSSTTSALAASAGWASGTTGTIKVVDPKSTGSPGGPLD